MKSKIIQEEIQFEKLFELPLRNGLFRPSNTRGSGIKMVNMKEIFANNRIGSISMEKVPMNDDEKQKFLLQKGDLLFARQSLVYEGTGKCVLVTNSMEHLTFESHIIRARLNTILADPRFYYYFFNSRIGRQIILSIVEQTGASGIRGSDLKQLMIVFFPIEYQKKIADIFESMDNLIDNLENQNKILEQIAQTIFKSWFVDFEFPKEDGKSYQSSGGKMIESKKGKIPKGWRVGTFSEIIYEIESGKRPKGGIDPLDSEIPNIGAENIIGLGQYHYSKTKFVSSEFFNKMKTGKIKEKDVLLYKDGANLGRSSLFRNGFPFEKCCINEHVFILRPSEKTSSSFLFFYIDQNFMKQEIKNLNSNSAQPGINKPSVLSLPILIPKINMNKQFEILVEPILTKFFKNVLECNQLSKIRDILLPKLMSGKIRIPMEVRK